MIPPRRILIIRPCCIGDVVQATAVLVALRHAYPNAIIHWAVTDWAKGVIAHHPALDEAISVGNEALPVKSIRGFSDMVKLIRREKRSRRYNLVVSLVRSPLMSLAVKLANPEMSVGIHSGWRGFGYDIRLPIHPANAQHECEIYLNVIAQFGIDITDAIPSLPIEEIALEHIEHILKRRSILKNASSRFIVVNPAGGMNPGMNMTSKRYPIAQLAEVVNKFADEKKLSVVIVAGPNDSSVVNELRARLTVEHTSFVGDLTFAQISALAHLSTLYLGNDTGLTHIAAASGTPTAMFMGPSDPKRYAPYTPNSIALWKPVTLNEGGVAQANDRFDWERDGISVEDALNQLRDFLTNDDVK